MISPTYTATLDLLERMASSTVGSIRVPAEFAIFNKIGSGKRVLLSNFQFIETSTNIGNSTNPITGLLQRISAHEYKIENIVNPVKYDSSNNNLPIEIEACLYPNSITVSNEPVRKLLKAPLAFQILGSITGASQNLVLSLRFLKGGTRAEWGDAVYSCVNSNLQYIKLREGEGFSFHSNDTNNQTSIYELSVGVRNSDTGECYLYRITHHSHYLPVFSLMNNLGSGINLEIFSISLQDVGGSTNSRFSLEPISGIINKYNNDKAINVIPHDSREPLNSNIIVSRAGSVTTKFVGPTSMRCNRVRPWCNPRYSNI